MKTFVIALATALLIAGQLFSPATAASNTIALASDCGTTYVVTRADNLSKIASKCNTTVADILSRNPQITNPNIILVGQVIYISGSGSYSSSTSSTSFNYTVLSGDTLSSVAAKFGVTVYSIKLINPTVMNTGSISTGQVIKIPNTYTYSTSGSNKTTYNYARISLSTNSVKPGGSVTVYVYGFPKNASIDYRVREEGENFSKAYDGTTESDGTDELTITIPTSANHGEDWEVLVTTTDQVQTLDVTSPTIHITD